METKICIENIRVKSKIKSFVKTCDSLLEANKDLDSTQQAINSFKLLLRFLKNDKDLSGVYEKFNSTATISRAYRDLKAVVEDDFSVIVGNDENSIPGKYQIGDIIQLGINEVEKKTGIEKKPLYWVVVDIQADKALVFAKKSCLWEPFDFDGGNNWLKSSLRRKLNGKWLKTTFTDSERAEIVVPEQKRSADDFSEGPVFVFTVDEFEKYATDEELRRDKKNVYWLVAKGETKGTVAFVSRAGELQTEGSVPYKTKGVRPAFWINNALPESTEQATEESLTDKPNRLVIVDDAKGYYIVYAGAMEKITSEYLRSASSRSDHYSTYEETIAAVNRYKTISEDKTELVVEEINMTDLMNKEYEEKHKKFVVTDKNDSVVLCIYANGTKEISHSKDDEEGALINKRKYIELIKEQFSSQNEKNAEESEQNIISNKEYPSSKEDEECRLINKRKYVKLVKEQISIQNEKFAEEFDHKTIGKIVGYEFAMECNVPRIRYEVFKAENMLESFNEYPDYKDTYTDDEKYYTGYKEALLHSIELQRQCIFQECEWAIHILDIGDIDKIPAEIEKEKEFIGYGKYYVNIYNRLYQFKLDPDKINLVFGFVTVEDETTLFNTRTALNLPDDVPLVFDKGKKLPSVTDINNLIKSSIEQETRLGNGNAEISIPEEFLISDSQDRLFKIGEIKEPEMSVKAGVDFSKLEDFSEIHEYMFKDCVELQTAILPPKMEKLPEGLFFNCKVLNYVSLPDNLRVIGRSVFEECKNLWTIYTPLNIERIEDRAFFGCSDLKNIYFPGHLEYIGSKAFSGCTKLTEIHIPDSIKEIADDAFENCHKIERIRVPEGFELPESLKDVKIKMFEKRAGTEKTSIENRYKDQEGSVEQTLNNVLFLLGKYYTSSPVSFATEINIVKEESDND